MQFTSEQLAPEQEQARQWHMWLRVERCGRPPDDEGMSMGRRGREEDAEGCLCVCVGWGGGACGRHASATRRRVGFGYWACPPLLTSLSR